MEITVFFFSYDLSHDATLTRKGLDALFLVLLFKGEKLVGISLVAWKPPEQHADLSFSQKQIP